VLALLSHLDLRAVLLRTARAEKQAEAAKWIVFAALFLAGFAVVTVVLAGLWSSFTSSPFAPVVTAVALAMMAAFLGIFHFLRRVEWLEPKLFQATIAASLLLAPFVVAAFVGVHLFMTTTALGEIAGEVGNADLKAWVGRHPFVVAGFVSVLMIAAMGAKYIHGRYRAPSRVDRPETLIISAMVAVLGVPLGVFLVFFAIVGVKKLLG
jgi:hypothetical protein